MNDNKRARRIAPPFQASSMQLAMNLLFIISYFLFIILYFLLIPHHFVSSL